MGFTPVAGLMMGTRAGEVDPGILLYLMKEKGLTADQVDDAINHQSGLLGVSGVSSDYRQVEEAANSGNERARLALEIYAARVRSAIGALAATLGGLVTPSSSPAGIGENSATLRAGRLRGARLPRHPPRPRVELGANPFPATGDIAARGRLAPPGSSSSTPAKTS